MQRAAALLEVKPEVVLQVARAEALAADPHGVSPLGVADLAARSGVASRLAAKARIVLIEAGLESLASHSADRSRVRRTLHERYS